MVVVSFLRYSRNNGHYLAQNHTFVAFVGDDKKNNDIVSIVSIWSVALCLVARQWFFFCRINDSLSHVINYVTSSRIKHHTVAEGGGVSVANDFSWMHADNQE